jgi:hypothetical protein
MRLSTANYLSNNENEILKTDKFSYIKNIIPEEYINSKDKNLNLELFKKEKIIPQTSEPEISLMGITALLFNVNLELKILEGFSNDINNYSQLKFYQINLPSRINDFNTKNISLFYRNSKWSIFYKTKFSFLHKDFLRENLLLNSEKIEEKFNTIDFECEKCHKFTKILCIKKYTKFYFCQNCLKNHAEKIMENRKEFFKIANYQDKECK